MNTIKGNTVSYSYNKTIVELFEEQVRRTPENIAILTNEGKLTYRELNLISNQIGHWLRKQGVKNNSIIGVKVERSPEMIILIYGILKAGGAYLPIDTTYPLARIQSIVEDCDPDFVIIDDAAADNLPTDVRLIDLTKVDLSREANRNLSKINCPHDLVYVIYTSGTTGRPKGVLIEHHSLINRIEWMQRAYPITEKDVLIQKTIYTFDVSVWEIFWWAIRGAGIFLLEPKTEHNPRAFTRIIQQQQISVIHFVPTMLRLFLDYVEIKQNQQSLVSLRLVFVSGEKLNSGLVKRFYQIFAELPEIRLINLYGPTEATIDVTYYECLRGYDYQEVPIGKPIDNIGIYIVDENDELAAEGEPGELCIGGVGLARGYLNREELTNEKFPTLKFGRVYRTGDLAKYSSEGNVVFVGRKDNQVKLRGLRVELEEIEFHLVKHQFVKEAVVCVKNSGIENQYLAAYLVVTQPVSSSELKTYLSNILPEYMVPSLFKILKKFPLKPNGKIDRSSLPDPF